MGSFQIWSYHVTRGKNLSLLYSKSYSPLNFRKSHQILWFCCIPNGSYKEDNLMAGRISPPPPPQMWNRVKVTELFQKTVQSLPKISQVLGKTFSWILWKMCFPYVFCGKCVSHGEFSENVPKIHRQCTGVTLGNFSWTNNSFFEITVHFLVQCVTASKKLTYKKLQADFFGKLYPSIRN